jgi:hypothetical protein
MVLESDDLTRALDDGRIRADVLGCFRQQKVSRIAEGALGGVNRARLCSESQKTMT